MIVIDPFSFEDIFNTSNHNKLKNMFVSWRLPMSYTEHVL